MGKKIIGTSIDNTYGYLEVSCILRYDDIESSTDEFKTPYSYEVLMTIDDNCSSNIQCVEVHGAEDLFKVIDNKDCLPDVGLLDYDDKELRLHLKDVTLRELYKEILNKLLK